jgi:hypothetical protein
MTPDHVGDGLRGELVEGLEGGEVGGGEVLVVALEHRLGARVGALRKERRRRRWYMNGCKYIETLGCG